MTRQDKEASGGNNVMIGTGPTPEATARHSEPVISISPSRASLVTLLVRGVSSTLVLFSLTPLKRLRFVHTVFLRVQVLRDVRPWVSVFEGVGGV